MPGGFSQRQGSSYGGQMPEQDGDDMNAAPGGTDEMDSSAGSMVTCPSCGKPLQLVPAGGTEDAAAPPMPGKMSMASLATKL